MMETEPCQIICVVNTKNTIEKTACNRVRLVKSTSPDPNGMSSPITGIKRLLNNLSLIIKTAGFESSLCSPFIFPNGVISQVINHLHKASIHNTMERLQVRSYQQITPAIF